MLNKKILKIVENYENLVLQVITILNILIYIKNINRGGTKHLLSNLSTTFCRYFIIFEISFFFLQNIFLPY